MKVVVFLFLIAFFSIPVLAGTITMMNKEISVVKSSFIPSSGITGAGTANRVAYWTNGTNIVADDDFFFDGTNVGIGTTTPTQKLDVSGNIKSTSNIYTGINNFVFTYGIKPVSTGYPVSIYNNSDSKIITVSEDGKVGILTETPSSTLEVNGNVSANLIYENGSRVCTPANGLCNQTFTENHNGTVEWINFQTPDFIGGNITTTGSVSLNHTNLNNLYNDTNLINSKLNLWSANSSHIWLNNSELLVKTNDTDQLILLNDGHHLKIQETNWDNPPLVIQAGEEPMNFLTEWRSFNGTRWSGVDMMGNFIEHDSRVCTPANGLCNQTFPQSAGGNGTATYLARWLNTSHLTNSHLIDDNDSIYTELSILPNGAYINLGHSALPFNSLYASNIITGSIYGSGGAYNGITLGASDSIKIINSKDILLRVAYFDLTNEIEVFNITKDGEAFLNGSKICTPANGLCNQTFTENHNGTVEWINFQTPDFIGGNITTTGSVSLNHTNLNNLYNDTSLINAVNTTNNIKSLGFNTTTELENLFLSSESDPLYVAENSTIARVGSCPSGKFVVNTTINGVECAPSGGGNITGSGATNYIPYWVSGSDLGATGMKYVNNKLFLGTELPYGGYLNIYSIAQGNNYYQNGVGMRLSHFSGNYGDTAGLYFLSYDTHTSGSPSTYGIIFDTQAAHSGTASGGSITGMYMLTRQASDKQLYYMYGLYPYLYIQGTGAVSAAYNIYLPLYVASGSQLTYYYGIFIPTPNVLGTLYNNYGIYMKNQSKGLSNNYAIYTEGGNLLFTLNSNEKIVIRGQPSQTANLQEWQNGSTVISYVGANGLIYENGSRVCTPANGLCSGGGGGGGIQSISGDSYIIVNNGSLTNLTFNESKLNLTIESLSSRIAYGGLWDNSSVAYSITANTWVLWNGSTIKSDFCYNVYCNNATSGSLQVNSSGIYKVELSLSFSHSASAATHYWGVFKNDILQPNLMAANGITLSLNVISITGFLNCDVGDNITLKHLNTLDSTYTVKFANFNIYKVG